MSKARYDSARSEVLKIMKRVDREAFHDSAVMSGVLWMTLADAYVVYRVGDKHVLLYVEQGIFRVDTEKSEGEIITAVLKAKNSRELIDLLQ